MRKIAIFALFCLILSSGCASSDLKTGGQGAGGSHLVMASSHSIGVSAQMKPVPYQPKKGGRMRCMPCMGEGLGLIAVALGYLVFLAARKEKKEIKDLGLAIGVVSMVLGAILLAANIYFKVKPFLKGGCPIASKQHCYQQLPKEQEPPNLGFPVKK